MDRIIVTSILIIGAITSAGLVVFSVSSNIREDSQVTANLQSAMGDQLRTKIQIASATANPQGTLFQIWATNIGSVDITPIGDTDVFLERTDNTWGARIPNGAPGISWSVQPTPPDQIWEVGETLQLNISLPAGADPGFPIAQRLGTYQATLVTPNGAHAEHVFDHNPMFRLFAFGRPSEGGAVTGSNVYPSGTVVNVTQVANAGFMFDNWSRACSGTGACTVTMDASKAVTANFSRSEFTLTATPAPGAGGTVTGGGTYPIGTVVNVTQAANAGFTFDNWSEDCSGTGPCTVTMDADKNVEANYSAAAPPPQPPAGCNPTPAGAVPVLNSITMSSGYPRQMLAVDGDTGGARVIWGAGSGTETIIETGQGGTRYFQVPETAQPGPHPVAIRAGANTSNIVCVTVRAVSGAFPAPRIEDIGLNGRTGSDVAMTISAANLDAEATLTVNGTPVPARYLSSALPVAYQLTHIPATFGYPIYHYAQIRGIVSNPTIGSTLNVTVTNTDGQSDSKNYTLPTRWEDLDSDGDGLLDTWEDSGYTRPGGGTVNLPAMGTTKYKKDLLLETDWIADTAPGVANWDIGVFPPLVNLFANGPVLNPDGTTGVRLIVDHGQGGAFTEGGNIMTPNHISTGYEATCPDPSRCGNGYVSFHDYKNNYFNPDRLGLFHYYIMARTHWRSPNVGGQAEFPDGNLRGDDVFCIAQRGNASNFQCIAHELGHNLGLAHGGLIGPPSAALFDHTNGSPNLYSIMNYSYSYGGVPPGCTPPTWFQAWWDGNFYQNPAGGPATFSEGIRMPLVEANINENTGVCDNIPWDLNKVEFSGDARGDGQFTVGPLDVVNAYSESVIELVCCNSRGQQFWQDGTRATVRDYDQWGNMILDFRTCWIENKGTTRRPRC